MVGLAWAFTPLVGAQIFLCALTWLVARRLFKWNFSLVVACAWTWATNFATMVPAYYTFYVTGYYMLGLSRTNRLDFALCVQPLKEAIAAEPGVLNAAILSIAFLFKDVGLVMAVGCIPYMVLSGWLGYRFTLWYLKKKRYGVSRNH
jgi:uncharacterized protein (DUF2062 family)